MIKPHFKKQYGLWICTGLNSGYFGYTIQEAYKKWIRHCGRHHGYS